ncbi:MAG: thymidine phosphorylase [Bacteroidetes bacterium]|nr:MAG: thymidine phosphorylase [Bacteroidota bacterium]
MNAVELIRLKRDGRSLSDEQIEELIAGYTRGDVPDYQMSAFLMASFLNGFSASESAALTKAMLHSGEVLDLSDIPGLKVDKHSTGGVGDKVSLILAPIVAACGVLVPMISGRGLGHTGGTLDKLESIPGFRTDLTIEQYRGQLAELGIVLIGQTAEIAPADKLLYALRDVTATVEFIPFIAASIMSKKLAEGIDALVLDVKCGSGAFMKTTEQAMELAEALVAIGEEAGTPTVALLTDMESPMGNAIGNWPEVMETVECLGGAENPDVMEVTYELAAEMIVLGEKAKGIEEARQMAQDAIHSGRALKLFRDLVTAQGGHADSLDDPSQRLAEAKEYTVRYSGTDKGIVKQLNAFNCGLSAIALGAGRETKEDVVDPLAGIILARKPGDVVNPGDTLASLYSSDPERFEEAENILSGAFSYAQIGDQKSALKPERLLNRYSNGSWMHQPDTLSV